MKKIVFTGGGTIGHVTLNLLLIPKFIQDNWEIHYIGTRNGIEYQQIKVSGFPVIFHTVSAGKFRRYFSLQNFLDVFKVFWGFLQSLVIMIKFRPEVVFSKGGFVSVPPVIAARLMGILVFVHESDLSVGLANRIAYKFSKKMYTTFEQTDLLNKMECVGAITKIQNQAIVETQITKRITDLFDSALPTILFVGGSSGSKFFNNFVTQHKEELVRSYNIINLSGDECLNEESFHFYRVACVNSYYQSVVELADVVITRGGANTLFELLAMAKPHLIVPLGKSASRGDQIENAAYFEKKGYAKCLQEDQLELQTLNRIIEQILEEKESYIENMKNSHDIRTVDDFYQLLKIDIDCSR